MKPIIKTGLAAILLLAISCTKEGTIKPVTVSSESVNNSVAAHYIGQRYGGGVIFYIDSTGHHGLIAAIIRKPQRLRWWSGVFTVTGATGTQIGTGAANTRKIILIQGDSLLNYAAIKCARYKSEGYTDWYMPSKDELNELYKQKTIVGVSYGYTWSSSETGQAAAWKLDFANGYWTVNNKNNKGYFNPIRSF